MIAVNDLRRTAREHLRAAEVLHKNRKYDAAVYLSGYAVEIALKARLCRTLRWTAFPATGGEFQNFKSLQTHNLSTLLTFSGIETRIKPSLVIFWSVVTLWNPEQRYQPVGTQTQATSQEMLTAVTEVLKVIL